MISFDNLRIRDAILPDDGNFFKNYLERKNLFDNFLFCANKFAYVVCMDKFALSQIFSCVGFSSWLCFESRIRDRRLMSVVCKHIHVNLKLHYRLAHIDEL